MKHQFAKFHQEPNRTTKLHIFHPIPRGDELDFHGSNFEKQFIEVWELSMKNFNNGIAGFQTRWCITKQNQVSFSQLKELKCWDCKNFILKHGECDPL